MKKPFSQLSVLAAAILVTPMALAAPGDRLALVSSEGENKVVVVDLETERTVKTLPTGKIPHAMAISPDGTIFVNNRGSRELTIIDGMAVELAGTIPLPATSFQLSMSPDGKTLAVAYKDALKLSLVDASTHAIIKTIDVGNLPKDGFSGVMMKHPTWTEDGKFVYVADAVHKAIVKVDVVKGRVAKTIKIDGVNHYLHPSPDGTLLYAVNEKQGRVPSLTLIDAASDTIVKSLRIDLAEGELPDGHHGTFTPDGRHFVYCNAGGRQVSVMDIATQKWVKTIPTGNGPGHAVLSPDGRYFFVVHHNDGVITVIDAFALETIKNIKIGEGTKQAHAAWFTPDGKFFYAVTASDKALVKIDVATMEVVSRMPVAAKSFFFAIKDGQSFPPTE